MKNIAISGTWLSDIPDGNITTIVVDVDRACLWMASERLNADADTEVDIYKKGLPADPCEAGDVSSPLQGHEAADTTQIHCHHRYHLQNSSQSLYRLQVGSFQILLHRWSLSRALLVKSRLSSSCAEETSR